MSGLSRNNVWAKKEQCLGLVGIVGMRSKAMAGKSSKALAGMSTGSNNGRSEKKKCMS